MFERIKTTINLVHKENPNKSKAYIFFDMVFNVLRYGLSFTDYKKCNFINLSKSEKQKCLSMSEYRKMIKYLNDEKYDSVFLDKILFNKVFKKYINREFIDLRTCSLDDFINFIKNKETFFVKKHNSFGGDGVKKIINKNLNYEKLYNELISNKQYLVEETIIQHSYLNKINSKAVNNIRIVTLIKDRNVYIIAKVLRLSDGIEEVISCHDIMVSLDDEGNFISKAYDDNLVNYQKHPTSNFSFEKGKVPFMKEMLDMACKAAMEVPEVRFVGWDFTLTEKGPLIIEGNFFPSYGLHQYYLLNKDYFFKDKLKKILKEEFDNRKK